MIREDVNSEFGKTGTTGNCDLKGTTRGFNYLTVASSEYHTICIARSQCAPRDKEKCALCVSIFPLVS